jgi:hypothetical protein
MDFRQELDDIGKLMMSASLLIEIRREVATVMRDGFIVSDGLHHPLGGGYDVVVRCGSEDRPDVLRRIRGKIQDVQVEKIADGVLGIKSARRTRRMKE